MKVILAMYREPDGEDPRGGHLYSVCGAMRGVNQQLEDESGPCHALPFPHDVEPGRRTSPCVLLWCDAGHTSAL